MNKNTSSKESLNSACAKIAPLWPLKDYVAVNPYLGFREKKFFDAAHLLKQRSNISVAMPLQFYLNKIKEGIIAENDVSAALLKYNRKLSVSNFLEEAANARKTSGKNSFKTVGDVVQSNFKIEVNEVMVDCITKWASTYFDEEQAIWGGDKYVVDLYESWRQNAKVDRTPEIYGLKGFRQFISELPMNKEEVLQITLETLGVEGEMVEAYIHTLLLRTVGWSSYIAGRDWHNSVYGSDADHLQQYALILLSWEYAVYCSTRSGSLKSQWSYFRNQYKEENSIDSSLMNSLILQESFDLANQRILKNKLERPTSISKETERPSFQAVFCIDVRSEVYRRNLELVDPKIETIGFAGFFGFPVKYRAMGAGEVEHQCPVLIPSGQEVKESTLNPQNNARKERLVNETNRLHKTWKNFKSGIVSSYAFVSPLGIYFIQKLVGRSFASIKSNSRSKWISERTIDLSNITIEERVNMASNALTLMGLKNNLAKWVMITGHGSTSTNNPHAAGLDCGACGGHSGEVNAIVAAQILNDEVVRRGLQEKGIEIPHDTVFVAAIHDTTTDEITVNTRIPKVLLEEFKQMELKLSTATELTRKERAHRFKGIDNEKDLIRRAFDWSQVRPEWGLAGCDSFIVAPRERTKGIDLSGRSFLHNYNWKSDHEFKILELIMTAPMVVTSWINLQYYASVTDPNHFGAGNKTIHNVTAGIGVLEGKGGDLKTGLALQSVSDGREFQHQPIRLNVVLEAPKTAVNSILSKHPDVKELVDNGWIHLFLMNEEGKISEKYRYDTEWEVVDDYQPTRLVELQIA